MVNGTMEAVGSPRKDQLKKGGPGEHAEARSRGFWGFLWGAAGAYKAAALSRVYEEEALKIQAIVRYTRPIYFRLRNLSIYHRQIMLLYAQL